MPIELINRGDARGTFRAAGADTNPIRLHYCGGTTRCVYVDEISDSGTWTTGIFVKPAELYVESFAGETNAVTTAHVVIRDVSGGSVEFDVSATQFIDWYKRSSCLDWTDLCQTLMRMDPNIRFNVYPNNWREEWALNRVFDRCSVGTFLCKYVAHSSEPEPKVSEDEWKKVMLEAGSAL